MVNAIDADIVEKTTSAVQGILGLNHNSERVEECDQITVPKQGSRGFEADYEVT
jgi:hypothetical protein